MRLNLGCGMDYRKDCINVDISPNVKVDMRFSLDEFPYPLDDESVSYLYCSHTLEHLKEPEKALNEFKRIIRPGGVLHIRTPHSCHISNWGHIQHRRAFSLHIKYFLTDCFELMSEKLEYGNGKYSSKYWIRYLIDIPINFLANLHIRLCERVWCYWVGGFEGMELIMRKK